jgi:glycerophosphoryl diester phosphodiesterase
MCQVTKIAHRGYSDIYKDNTMEAFKKAVEREFDMIEMDLQLCKHDIIIIYHDQYIQKKLISDLTIEEIKHIDNDIMTFEEFIYKFDYTKTNLYLDLKGSNKLAEKLHQFIDVHNLQYHNIHFASFNLYHLEILFNFNKSYKLGLITYNHLTNDMLDFMIKKYKLYFVALSWNTLEETSIEYIKSLHVKVYTYTADKPCVLEFIKKYNVDGIVSNIRI